MAKENMLCPFSGDLCRECPVYRGRHYYLCYNSEYRGHIEDPEHRADKRSAGTTPDRLADFQLMPALEPSPTWLVLDEFVEREAKE